MLIIQISIKTQKTRTYQDLSNDYLKKLLFDLYARSGSGLREIK